jgi:hypothetical protein
MSNVPTKSRAARSSIQHIPYDDHIRLQPTHHHPKELDTANGSLADHPPMPPRFDPSSAQHGAVSMPSRRFAPSWTGICRSTGLSRYQGAAGDSERRNQPHEPIMDRSGPKPPRRRAFVANLDKGF